MLCITVWHNIRSRNLFPRLDVARHMFLFRFYAGAKRKQRPSAWTLSKAHDSGQLVRVTCVYCSVKHWYAPADLQRLLGDIRQMPFGCAASDARRPNGYAPALNARPPQNGRQSSSASRSNEGLDMAPCAPKLGYCTCPVETFEVSVRKSRKLEAFSFMIDHRHAVRAIAFVWPSRCGTAQASGDGHGCN